MHMIKT